MILILSTIPVIGSLSLNRYSHRSRRPRNDFSPVLDIKRVEVLDLGLGDLAALLHRHLADLVLVRLPTALFALCGGLEQFGRGWALELDVEGAVLVDRYQHADDLAVEVGA